MRKFMFTKYAALALGLALSACSTGNVTVATYQIGGESKKLTVSDLSNVHIGEPSPRLVSRWTSLLSNTNKEQFYTSSSILPEVLYYEAEQSGATNDEDYLREIMVASNAIRRRLFSDHILENLSKTVEKQKVRMARASHILFQKQPGVDEEVARSNAMAVLETLQKESNVRKAFTEAVLEYSDDRGTKQNAGDLGYFEEGRMVPEFSKAVFSAKKPGLVEGLIETQYGYHIIYIQEPPKMVALSTLKKDEDARVYNQRLNNALSDFVFSNQMALIGVSVAATSNTTTNAEAAVLTNVEGERFDYPDVPGTTKVATVLGKDYTYADFYTWRTNIAHMMQITNEPSLTDIPSILAQYMNIQFIEGMAAKDSYSSSSEYKKAFQTAFRYHKRNFFFQKWTTELIANLDSNAAPEEVQAYLSSNQGTYNQILSNAMRQTNVKPPKTASDIEKEVQEIMKRRYVRELAIQAVSDRADQISQQNQVAFSSKGLQAFDKLLEKLIQEFTPKPPSSKK